MFSITLGEWQTRKTKTYPIMIKAKWVSVPLPPPPTLPLSGGVALNWEAVVFFSESTASANSIRSFGSSFVLVNLTLKCFRRTYQMSMVIVGNKGFWTIFLLSPLTSSLLDCQFSSRFRWSDLLLKCCPMLDTSLDQHCHSSRVVCIVEAHHKSSSYFRPRPFESIEARLKW